MKISRTLLVIVFFSLVVIGIFVGKWLTEADYKVAALKVEEKVAEVISIGNGINRSLSLTKEEAKGQKWDLGTYPSDPDSINEACVFLANNVKFWMNVARTHERRTYVSMRSSLLAANYLKLYELCGCRQYQSNLMLRTALELRALEQKRLGERKKR